MDLEGKEKQRKRVKKKAVVSQSECVACGSCTKVCPREAVTIDHGIYATINEELCIGCGKCKIACPASIISLKERAS